MALKCPLCGFSHRPSESCGKDSQPSQPSADERFAALMANFVVVMAKLDKIAEELERLAEMEPKVPRPPVAKTAFNRAAYMRAYRAKQRAER